MVLVETGFQKWWGHHRPDQEALITPFRVNETSGFSSESLLFDVHSTRRGNRYVEEFVLRLPPAGGGLFPEYDLERQSATQTLLARAGVPAPAPVLFEPDTEWIGTPFMLMPRVAGNIPGDYSYPRKGWLHDCDPLAQRSHFDAFVDSLGQLLAIGPNAYDTAFLARSRGTGLLAEIGWWADYLSWACDGVRHPIMSEAYSWAMDTAPPDDDPPSILWGDARFANTIFDQKGQVAAMLDWEQAAIGPAELDIGFWLATRRQARDVVGVQSDPELPGFRDRHETLERLERALRRPLRAVEWHETFAMVRMGSCIVSTSALLRRSGQPDHPFVHAPPLPAWALDVVTDRHHE